MAGIAGRNLSFTYNAVDQSANVDDVEFTIDAGMKATTTFGASVDSTSYTVTLKDGKFTAKGPFVAAFHSAMWALFGTTGTQAFIIGPQGSTSGQEKITGNARVKSIKVGGKVDDVLQIQVEFQADGTVTRTVF